MEPVLIANVFRTSMTSVYQSGLLLVKWVKQKTYLNEFSSKPVLICTFLHTENNFISNNSKEQWHLEEE